MKKLSVGAGGAIIKSKKVLLLKRVETKSQFPNCWGFAAGGYEEFDELLENTVIREVKEESNLDFKPTKRLNFYEMQNNDFLNVMHVYLGDWSGEIKVEEKEVSDFGWFSYQEAMKLNFAFAYREVVEDLFKLGLIE